MHVRVVHEPIERTLCCRGRAMQNGAVTHNGPCILGLAASHGLIRPSILSAFAKCAVMRPCIGQQSPVSDGVLAQQACVLAQSCIACSLLSSDTDTDLVRAAGASGSEQRMMPDCSWTACPCSCQSACDGGLQVCDDCCTFPCMSCPWPCPPGLCTIPVVPAI